MKRNPFFKLLARLRVGHKLLLIYLLDLSAVIYISGILIHEKYLAIDFSNKEIVGNAYVHEVEHSITSIAMAGAGKPPTPAQLDAEVDRLVLAEQQYGAQMGSAEPSNALRTALQTMALERELRIASTDRALTASRDLITRIGNQSNLILDPDLDSYYAMSLSILRYPALLTAVNGIGRHLHDGVHVRSREEVRSRYLVLEGQLDGVMQGLRSDYAEAGAANRQFERTLTPSFDRMRTAVEAFRHAARVVVEDNVAPDAAVLMTVDSAQQALVQSVDDLWRDTGEQLDGLLHARVQALFSRMWLHLGTALFLLCAILTLVYCVAQQISSPLRKLARVMDVVRRTGDHTKRADWDSQDEIGQLVRGFNEMLAQLDRERVVQKELAATARASAAQSALVEATPVPMVVTAIPGHEVLHANAPGLFWLNGSSTDPWAQGLDSATRARFFQQLSDREAIDEFEVHWKATSQPSWAMLSARRLAFQGRDAILTAFTPINQIKLMEQRLELWGKVFEASSEAIVILNAEARLLTANPSFFRATGYRIDDVAGKPPAFIDSQAQDDENGPLGNLLQRVGRSSTWHGEAQISRREGGDYPAWLMISAVHDKRGTVSHYICTLIDITDRKKSEARIQFLAQHDVLTELPNRALFAAKLGVAIAAAQRTRQRVAVLFIDLDRFKNINDSLGHHIGDGLLRSVSRRLLNAVGTDDTVSRLGGDEFTVLLNRVGHASEVARSIEQRLLPLLREAHEVSGLTLQVASSIGVALYPDDGEDIDTLMQNADAAMYQAKSAGRNQVKFFSADMAEQARHRLTLETCLRTAIEFSELRLEWQPCLEARSGALASVEGLLRWKSAVLGDIGPAVFIPVAEDTRLIVSIGAWVIEEACRQLAAWRDEAGLEIRASVNISAIQLREPELVAALAKSLLAHGVPPHCLELEITETVLMDGAQHYAQAISRHSRARRQALARRLWHRLLESQLSEPDSARPSEDRPRVRARHARRVR